MKKMVFDEVNSRAFVLENHSRTVYCYHISSMKHEENERSIVYEAAGEIIHFSAAYQNSSADPLRFCLIDNHADSLNLLKEHENQLVLAGEFFVTENLKKHVTSDMFFAYELLYQRDRFFFVQQRERFEVKHEKTEYWPLRSKNVHVINGYPKVTAKRLLYLLRGTNGQ